MALYQEALWGKPVSVQEKEVDRRFADPRADIHTDHQYWERLLWNCWNLDKELYYILHGIRCGGGELVLTQKSLKLLQGEWSDKRWDEIKQKDLSPHRDKLVEVLRTSRVMKLSDEKLPGGW